MTKDELYKLADRISNINAEMNRVLNDMDKAFLVASKENMGTLAKDLDKAIGQIEYGNLNCAAMIITDTARKTGL